MAIHDHLLLDFYLALPQGPSQLTKLCDGNQSDLLIATITPGYMPLFSARGPEIECSTWAEWKKALTVCCGGINEKLGESSFSIFSVSFSGQQTVVSLGEFIHFIESFNDPNAPMHGYRSLASWLLNVDPDGDIWSDEEGYGFHNSPPSHTSKWVGSSLWR